MPVASSSLATVDFPEPAGPHIMTTLLTTPTLPRWPIGVVDRAQYPRAFPRLLSMPASRVPSLGEGASRYSASGHRVGHPIAYDPPAEVLDDGASSATREESVSSRGPRADQATARARTAAVRARMPRSTSAADTASSGWWLMPSGFLRKSMPTPVTAANAIPS